MLIELNFKNNFIETVQIQERKAFEENGVPIHSEALRFENDQLPAFYIIFYISNFHVLNIEKIGEMVEDYLDKIFVEEPFQAYWYRNSDGQEIHITTPCHDEDLVSTHYWLREISDISTFTYELESEHLMLISELLNPGYDSRPVPSDTPLIYGDSRVTTTLNTVISMITKSSTFHSLKEYNDLLKVHGITTTLTINPRKELAKSLIYSLQTHGDLYDGIIEGRLTAEAKYENIRKNFLTTNIA